MHSQTKRANVATIEWAEALLSKDRGSFHGASIHIYCLAYNRV